MNGTVSGWKEGMGELVYIQNGQMDIQGGGIDRDRGGCAITNHNLFHNIMCNYKRIKCNVLFFNKKRKENVVVGRLVWSKRNKPWDMLFLEGSPLWLHIRPIYQHVPKCFIPFL